MLNTEGGDEKLVPRLRREFKKQKQNRAKPEQMQHYNQELFIRKDTYHESMQQCEEMKEQFWHRFNKFNEDKQYL